MFRTLFTTNQADTARNINKFRKWKFKEASIHEDIIFLKNCRSSGVFPKFMTFRTRITNSRSRAAQTRGLKDWLRREIKFKYASLAKVHLELYVLRQKIQDVVVFLTEDSEEEWLEEQTKIHFYCEEIQNEKRIKLQKKFEDLIGEQKPTINQEGNEEKRNFVTNLSTKTFSAEELEFLNKGLKHKIQPTKSRNDEIIVSIESAIKYENAGTKTSIREKCREVFENQPERSFQTSSEDFEMIKNLKTKGVYYMKPDKGNGVVILDQEDYEERMKKLIAEGDYEEIIDGRLTENNPVNVMQNNLKKHLKEQVECGNISSHLARSLTLSNPIVPVIYGLPKIHKEGEKMRPIRSSCNSPFSKLEKHIAKELENLNIKSDFELKNSEDFVERIKDLEIEEDEMMVSFDIVALFPNVPIDKAINTMKHHVGRVNIEQSKKQFIIKSVEVCTKMNQFQFRGKFYKQTKGLGIGSSISPKMASFFMLHFENKLKNHSLFPRIWLRYVDDVFAIVKKNDLQRVLDFLNSQFDTINFTYEEEKDSSLPFLDLLVKRVERRVKFAIYRKPTSTDLFIGADSHHCKSHKIAAFHSMYHRLFSTPMDPEDFEVERQKISEIGSLNGYSKETLRRVFLKHQRKQELRDVTTLQPVESEKLKFISLPFVPPITHKLDNELRKFGFKVAYNNNGKLADLLGTPKDKEKDENERSGIYNIKCADCDAEYIGETRRKFKIRRKEHEDDCRKPPLDEKPLAKHMIEEGHRIGQAKLIKKVEKVHMLDAYESLFLHKNKDKNLLNTQKEGNCSSILFKFSDP
jgi:hypothetical protein